MLVDDLGDVCALAYGVWILCSRINRVIGIKMPLSVASCPDADRQHPAIEVVLTEAAALGGAGLDLDSHSVQASGVGAAAAGRQHASASELLLGSCYVV